ncbi:COG3772 Phage-related lysozyme (muraminidase) [uncultured Caudovirales phage]|uniref:Lysozyme n=1 Tax=uncultured Caudovirales phage TaxID=2100421 RepID=A0A6J5NFF7_9CAUD|nr:COG3772 Phage-related lysozyme (muraminidase) [uncultured Caudovirales phage]CAB4157949.1 COG3772 Phage-related lysozyme (muraminidase) [uncultured Caudovirales phage]CAB5225598.1 COG3772 Phage-related lysozyme (muraminidase) [uncultured Caudovirales phage]
MKNLKDWIKKQEAFKSHPYLDTVGKLTIGWGRNIEDNGISKDEADYLFDNDFARCQRELAPFPWYVNSPQNVQDALMNMCFNLGIGRLLGFRKMIMALTAKDYTKAAIEALDSKWAEQVGQRAKDVALMMRQG